MDDKELQILLFSAIQHHNESLLNDLLDGEDGSKLLDVPGEDGNTLLHAAVIENIPECVECLIRHGADPNVFDTNQARTPLHLAVELGQLDIVNIFLKLDYVNLELRDDRNLTCYEIAQFCDNQNLAGVILTRTEEIEQMNNDFYSIANQACTNNQSDKVKHLFESQERQIITNLPNDWNRHKDKKLFARSRLKELINWSSSSWNDVTLLFKSASKGHTEVCKVLIEFGATAKCNENTNYSPLYVAAYGGFTETVRLLLDNFPSLVREVTIERWTVLHACCLQGHSDTAKLILNYSYPESLKSRYASRSGLYEYHFAFDLNSQDAAGQTVIYLAVSANNERLLDNLLHFNVKAKLISESVKLQTSSDTNRTTARHLGAKARLYVPEQTARIITDKPRVINSSVQNINSTTTASDSQLDKIIQQLNKLEPTRDLVLKPEGQQQQQEQICDVENEEYLICPFELDTYCDYNSKTALHLAVCQEYHNIATTLLVNGSNPNLPILSRDSIKNDFSSSHNDVGLNWLRSSKSTCLKEACRLNNEKMCEILIRYGANDNQDNLALQVASMNKNGKLISMFLSLKSQVDSEYKINKKCNVEFASRYKQNQRVSRSNYTGNSTGTITTTFSSMFPSTPVTIDWRNLRCIKQIDPQWLIDASLMHNKRLRHPTNSLMAITRLDLSSNNLKSVHPVIFRLPSLRELNLSKNRLECLLDPSQLCNNEGDNVPTSKLIESQRTAMKRSKSSNLSTVSLENSNMIDLNEPQEWDLPYLETFDLHDNLLISLPDCLFRLPKLRELDISSNQIRQLPWALWLAPSLREVIASSNLLDDLPRSPTITAQHSRHSNNLSGRLSNLADSPIEEGADSLTSDQSHTDKYEQSGSGSFTGTLERSFAIEDLKIDNLIETKCAISTTKLEPLNHWQTRIDLVSQSAIHQQTGSNQLPGDASSDQESSPTISKINYLNLSHNSFTVIPPVLACIATELTRLNLSFNRIESLDDISLYPAKLKTLDLSRNQISSWFQLLPNQQDSDTRHCYAENVVRRASSSSARSQSRLSGGGQLLSCPHKTHQRLESLKSINLSYNFLNDIKILQVDSLHPRASQSPQQVFTNSNHQRAPLLLFPNITALDVSFNRIQKVPIELSKLKDLSVLNLNGNAQITTLPAELGLASKLWNLGVSGCNLGEPLKSIVESKTYKTMDVTGYLRSILEEAKPYARMKLMLVGLQGIGKTSLLEQMRSEGSTSSRRRAPEHWTRRMGHTSRGNLRNQKGVTLSTVGVDIHDWIFCKRTPRNQPSFGPVTFSTWDFGGQEEFYATHRYFLSKRSIYLVVWSLLDGLNGIQGIQQWLVNIQSRASGSPVIIVGTHEDMIEGGDRGDLIQKLQAEVHRRFVNVSDQDKCGLPRVIDSIVVSSRTKYNVKNLCNLIYDVVFSLRCPGSAERLLEQKIPATYLYLEEIVSWIVHDRHQRKKEPVLTYDEYRKISSEQLKQRHNKQFRDLEPLKSREINYNSELQQATRFLHENGILLHYEDSNLRDLYFLDPQWLCDILSHVVTIREINPHVKNGLMRIDDLGFLFKSMDTDLSGGIQSYVVNLLNKFEVALTWNSQYLLIPSLLPNDPDSIDQQQRGDFQVKLAPRVRGRSAARKFDHDRAKRARATSIDPTRAMQIKQQQVSRAANDELRNFYSFEYKSDKSITRLVMLRYLPAGFLARLQSGLLSDPAFDDICADLHWNLMQDLTEEDDQEVAKLDAIVGNRAGWTCWKSGIRLTLQRESTINTPPVGDNKELLSPCLLTIQDLSSTTANQLKNIDFKIDSVQIGSSGRKQSVGSSGGEDWTNNVDIIGSNWCDFDISQYSSIISITIANLELRVTNKEDRSSERFLELDHLNSAKLLTRAVDHIDNLLEDWYPSLGARFAHTLGGNYLVTRVIPCQKCSEILPQIHGLHKQSRDTDRRSRRLESGRPPTRFSIGSAAATTATKTTTTSPLGNHQLPEVYCYYVEHCILNTYNLSVLNSLNAPPRLSIDSLQSHLNSSPAHKRMRAARQLKCPKHGSISLNSIAPDIVFDDLADESKIDKEQIDRCKLIGRGTLGFVFKGSLRSAFPLNQLAQSNQEVALKLLQPVDPGPEADQTDTVAYRSALTNWSREPFQSACKSYCTARHEINILQTLNHQNIVSFIGLCLKPLALVLELAPLGSLAEVFKNYKRAGLRIDQFSVQKSILQVARALEFLHQQRVVYRDLKTENILVWSFPSPYATQLKQATVKLKLADYGISRQALQSTGIWKGFAGTISFLAPEILRHNGDEEYTEKVDCFSFGMFMYELMTLRPPFKHGGGVGVGESSRSHLTDGGRPTLAPNDIIYPTHMFDLMSACWSQEPQDRPTASQIVSIASAPEFMQILDVVRIVAQDTDRSPRLACATQYCQSLDLWSSPSSANFKLQILSTDGAAGRWVQNQCVEVSSPDINSSAVFAKSQITCMCVVERSLWLCDSDLMIHTLPLKHQMKRFEQQDLDGSSASAMGMNSPDLAQQQDDLGSLIHSSSIHSFSLLNSQHIKPDWFKSMIYIEQVESVVFLTNEGHLCICPLDTMECEKLDCGSMLFNCVVQSNRSTSRLDNDHDEEAPSFHLLCGQTNGISSLEICRGEVCRQSILPLTGRTAELNCGDETVVDPSQSCEITSIVAADEFIWTAAGCTVHLWNIHDRQVVRKLDCWKLVPCSESLESINIEQYYQQARSSVVTSMVHIANQLFVGTSHGCFITIEANNLKPMIVFRPFESEITILKPIQMTNQNQTTNSENNNGNDEDIDSENYIVTLGKGYRDLMGRYLSSLGDGFQTNDQEPVSILLAANKYDDL